MANFDINPDFDLSIRRFETTDPAHAELFNNAFEKVIDSIAYLDDKSITDAERASYSDKYTKNEVDNKLAALETNIDWKESVETFSDIATAYPNPQDGWTVNVKDTDYTYRYNGSAWVTISANAIPKATSAVDGLLSKEDKTNLDDANVKKHTHSNKAVLDGITAENVATWNNTSKVFDNDTINKLVADDLLLVKNGQNGTKNINAVKLSNSIFELFGKNYGPSFFDKMGFDQDTGISEGCQLLFGIPAVNDTRCIELKDFYYGMISAMSMVVNGSGDYNVSIRKNVFRGKEIGATITSSQLKEIQRGTFNNMFLGDYWFWTDEETDEEYTFRIVDFDYFYRAGLNKHHILIMPDTCVMQSMFYNTNFCKTDFYTKAVSSLNTLFNKWINSANRLAVNMGYFSECDSEGYVTKYTNVSSVFNIPNQIMTYGNNFVDVNKNLLKTSTGMYTPELNAKQISLFKVNDMYINPYGQMYALSDRYAGYIVASKNSATISLEYQNSNINIRPMIAIG